MTDMPIEASRYVWDAKAQRTITVRSALTDVEDLLALLRRLSPTRQSVDLEAPNGNVLCVGVGVPDGWAAFATAEMVVRGELRQLTPEKPTTTEYQDSVIDFLCGGEPTEIRTSGLVPFEQVLAVAAHFMRTNDVPPELRWV